MAQTTSEINWYLIRKMALRAAELNQGGPDEQRECMYMEFSILLALGIDPVIGEVQYDGDESGHVVTIVWDDNVVTLEKLGGRS